MKEYASHMALLSTLAHVIGDDVVHVVELGCGLFSTPMWLNKSIWKNIQSVDSYEHNAKWLRHIEYITRDPRLTIMNVLPLSVCAADIILIDNGDNRKQRLEGIAHVIEYNVTGMVVLHDANEEQYMNAIAPHFGHSIIYRGAYPYTALLWNGDDFDYDEIKASMIVTETYECSL